jgi:uncharacterized protein (TIGR00266 family)
MEEQLRHAHDRTARRGLPHWGVMGKAGAAAVTVKLSRGQSIKAEPDALVTMSEHIELGARMDAGLLSGMVRSMVAQESLFVQTLLAMGDGDALLCAPEIGDTELIHVTPGEPYMLQKGAFLAADEAVEVKTTTQARLGNVLFSGNGLFVLHASGSGTLAVTAHGSILKFQLAQGETRAVDNGHLVCWSAAMPYEMRMAGGSQCSSVLSRMASSAASGEGLMCFFRGPGTLWLQTHKPSVADASGNGGARRARGAEGGAASGALGCLGCCFFLVVAIAVLVGIFVVVPAKGPARLAKPFRPACCRPGPWPSPPTTRGFALRVWQAVVGSRLRQGLAHTRYGGTSPPAWMCLELVAGGVTRVAFPPGCMTTRHTHRREWLLSGVHTMSMERRLMMRYEVDLVHCPAPDSAPAMRRGARG